MTMNHSRPLNQLFGHDQITGYGWISDIVCHATASYVRS